MAMMNKTTMRKALRSKTIWFSILLAALPIIPTYIGEFDLTPINAWRGQMVELGRSCVHAEHRQGGVILALWAALAANWRRMNPKRGFRRLCPGHHRQFAATVA